MYYGVGESVYAQAQGGSLVCYIADFGLHQKVTMKGYVV